MTIKEKPIDLKSYVQPNELKPDILGHLADHNNA